MKLYRTKDGVVIETGNGARYAKQVGDWDAYINRDDLFHFLEAEIAIAQPMEPRASVDALAPLVHQEIWAAGVTYLRSMHARVEESTASGGGNFYDKVYDAERPELFFKANAQRTVGNGGLVRIRKDSTWNVPEPELTLFITAAGAIVAYTIGNDMSSRSIEGENPLYLPQAKSYDGSAALGPCLYVPQNPIAPDTQIELIITREGSTIFGESIAISQMKRKHTELVHFLYAECSFPFGCFLMTGTGIVPPAGFTLQSGDEIKIIIEPIGVLKNTVA